MLSIAFSCIDEDHLRVPSKMYVQIGDTINQYKITDRIGEGGMGVVYLADDTRLQRKVALKFVSNASLDATEETARFHREARAAARLNHPNICTVYELGETEDKTYIAMEYVQGITLKERMRQGHIEESEIRKWLEQIAEGLQTAHDAGVIHRDIKPANIMINDKGLIKIMDFGIAKLAESETELTQANSTIGTIAYMSPEQARGEAIDQRTDIWSVGVILYELATGQRPFAGAFREAIMYALMHENPPAPSDVNPAVPDDIEYIIVKCLERDRSKRYGSLEEVLAHVKGRDIEKGVPLNNEELAGEAKDLLTVKSYRPNIGEEATLLGSKKRRILALGIIVFLGMLVMLPGVRSKLTGQGGTASGLPSAMHLAVLPFDTFGESVEEKAFSNGLAHMVAANLMRMEHDKKQMWVIPVREVLSRDVTSASEAREAFGINLAISGTIMTVGSGMQISLDVTDVLTLRAIASDVIELDVLDPGTVQEQVIQKLAAMLEMHEPGASEHLLGGDQTTDPEAYKLYIQAQGFIQQYDEEGNIEEAIRLYEEAIEIDSTYALAYAGAGFAYARKYYFVKEVTLFDKANAYVDKALELNDSLVEVWVAAGRVRLDSGKQEEAVVALEKAVSIDSNSYEANRRLGFAYSLGNDIQLAEEFYKKAISIQPNYWEGYNLLGLLYGYGFVGRHQESISLFNKAIELSPTNSIMYVNLATQYFHVGDTLKCIETLEHSIELNPNALAFNNLGITLRIAHEYDRALEAFRRAVVLSENSVDYNLNLGNSYFIVQQPDSARVYWLQAAVLLDEQLKVNPNDPNLLRLATEVYAKLGEVETAQRYFDQYLDLGGQSARYWNNVYMLYEYLDDRQNALAALENALEMGFNPWYLDWSPWLVDVYDDPSYKALLTKYKK